MAVTVFSAFIATASDELPNLVGVENDLQMATQPGCVLVPLPPVLCKTIKVTVVSASLCKSDYDVVLGFVEFNRVEEVVWSDDSSTGWFPYSWEITEVSSIPSFQRVTNKKLLSGARRDVEEPLG